MKSLLWWLALALGIILVHAGAFSTIIGVAIIIACAYNFDRFHDDRPRVVHPGCEACERSEMRRSLHG